MSLLAEIRSLVVGAGVAGERVFRDQAPPGVATPYAVLYDNIAGAPVLRGDQATLARRETVQVDVWYPSADDRDADRASVLGALDGAKVATGGYSWRLAVTSWVTDEALDDSGHQRISFDVIATRLG